VAASPPVACVSSTCIAMALYSSMRSVSVCDVTTVGRGATMRAVQIGFKRSCVNRGSVHSESSNTWCRPAHGTPFRWLSARRSGATAHAAARRPRPAARCGRDAAPPPAVWSPRTPAATLATRSERNGRVKVRIMLRNHEIRMTAKICHEAKNVARSLPFS
jgi:hypothetical protein